MRIFITALTPIIISLFAPLGITENTPFAEAIVLILAGLGTFIVAKWAASQNKHD